jgi:arylsulfatase A-like enzyme
MPRSTALRIALAAALLAAACGRGQDAAKRPNVVVISADTLRFDRLNTYGYRARTTSSHLDRLAADGIVFETAITASPWTMPAHMSLFTGLSPSAHGMVTPLASLQAQQQRNEVQRLPAERVTLAEALAAQGYRTAAFTGGGTMDPRIGFDQGFSVYRTAMFKMGDRSMGEMLAWIRERRPEPFFLFWHTFETHFPYLDPSFLSGVASDEVVRAAGPVLERIRAQLADEGLSDPRLGEAVQAFAQLGLLNRDACEALYTGAVRSVDRWLGVLLDALRAEGVYDDTLVVFMSDHGEEFAEHNPGIFYNGHGHSMFDELVHIPLVVKLPGSAHAGARVSAPARLIDVYPTVLDVLGLPPGAAIEGESLRPLWEHPDHAGTRTALVEATAFGYELKALRTPRRKYIVGVDDATVAREGRQYVPEEPEIRWLFDLAKDPKETASVMAPPVSDAIAEEANLLHRMLRALVPRSLGATERTRLDGETIERLRALGYVGDE